MKKLTGTREGIARVLAMRAHRLHRLVELGAPEIIIERERRLVEAALASFPVDDGARAQVDAQLEQEAAALADDHDMADMANLAHADEDCPLVARRIACERCGYPSGEARYPDVESFVRAGAERLLGDLFQRKKGH